MRPFGLERGTRLCRCSRVHTRAHCPGLWRARAIPDQARPPRDDPEPGTVHERVRRVSRCTCCSPVILFPDSPAIARRWRSPRCYVVGVALAGLLSALDGAGDDPARASSRPMALELPPYRAAGCATRRCASTLRSSAGYSCARPGTLILVRVDRAVVGSATYPRRGSIAGAGRGAARAGRGHRAHRRWPEPPKLMLAEAEGLDARLAARETRSWGGSATAVQPVFAPTRVPTAN